MSSYFSRGHLRLYNHDSANVFYWGLCDLFNYYLIVKKIFKNRKRLIMYVLATVNHD
jgi:hypothetical protein